MNSDARFNHHNERVKALALRAFRQRQARKLGAQAAAVCLAAAALIFYRSAPPETVKSLGIAAPPPPVETVVLTHSASPPLAVKREASTQLSDDELLAAFPPGSCFIAEVGGKKRLVFRSDEMRAKFMN